MKYKPLSDREEQIARQIVDATYTVHKQLGPGLLEKQINFVNLGVFETSWQISSKLT